MRKNRVTLVLTCRTRKWPWNESSEHNRHLWTSNFKRNRLPPKSVRRKRLSTLLSFGLKVEHTSSCFKGMKPILGRFAQLRNLCARTPLATQLYRFLKSTLSGHCDRRSRALKTQPKHENKRSRKMKRRFGDLRQISMFTVDFRMILNMFEAWCHCFFFSLSFFLFP